MEIVGTATHLLREKDSHIWSIQPDATVYEAIELMAAKNIGAVPVVDGGKLVGMVSERDYTRKVILRGKSSKKTAVREIKVTTETGVVLRIMTNDLDAPAAEIAAL